MWSRLWSLCLHGKQTWLPWSVYPELLCGGLMELTQTQHLLTCFLHFSDKVISDISLHIRAASIASPPVIMAAGASVSGEEWQNLLLRLIGISSFVMSFSHQYSWIVWPSFSNRELFLGHWPCMTHKIGGWLLPRSLLKCGWQWVVCAAFLGTVWEPGDEAAACASVNLCTAALAALTTLLLCYNFFLKPQQNRAELRSSVTAGLPFSHCMWRLLRSI